MPDHTISNQGIGAVKAIVVQVKTARFASGAAWKLFIFVPELGKTISEEIELNRIVHVDADQFALSIPKGFRQALRVRDGLVEVHWSHMKALALPGVKNLVEFSAV